MKHTKSWMPLWLAMTCAAVGYMAGAFLYTLVIIILAEKGAEYNSVLAVCLLAIPGLPVFWLLSYIRYNQFAYIKRLPLLLLFAWSIPVLGIIHAVVKSDLLYSAVFFGCITIFILAGCNEVVQNHRNKSKDSHPETAHVRESEEAEGFFEVVGGTKPNGKPYQTYYTPDHDKAERMAAERRNEGGL